MRDVMEVLEKIEKLRCERGWSIYKLAEESGLTQSTVANMFYRNSVPSISTLKQLCDAFGLTLSQFFEDNGDYTEDEMVLISRYRELPSKEKLYVNKIVEMMSREDRK